MSAPSIGLDLKGLGLKGLFRPDGSPYVMIPEEIDRLPSFWRTAAREVWTILLKYVREWGELDERLISRMIAEEIESRTGHRCESFVAKGLYALEHLAKLITRVRQRGRRVILFLVGLLGQERPAPARPGSGSRPTSPPAPPEEIQETTTTRNPSSSSLGSIPKEREGPEPTAPPELVARASALVDRVTPGCIAEAVTRFTAGWVSKALDVVERRNRKPGNVRKDWGYILGILLRWEQRGDVPEDPRPPVVPSRPSVARAVEEPEPPLAADQVAELVAAGRQAERIPARMARAQLRMAVAKGLVPAELVATIPPELLERE